MIKEYGFCKKMFINFKLVISLKEQMLWRKEKEYFSPYQSFQISYFFTFFTCDDNDQDEESVKSGDKWGWVNLIFVVSIHSD